MTDNGSVTELDKIPVTAADLLEVMGDNIRRLRSGETTPATANAIVNSTASMLRIVKWQMDYAKLTGSTPEIPLLMTPNRQGNGKAK
jgi:hypothetical protein